MLISFFNDTATTDIYALSLHDALPICHVLELSYLHSRDVTFAVFCQGPYDESARYRDFMGWEMPWYAVPEQSSDRLLAGDRNSTRLNSSHANISYAVFCLKKKKI